jgi:hydroxyacylglutathione hydrolase
MPLTIKPISAFDHNYIWLISNLALELATNPFLRCNQPDLQASLRSQGKLEGESTADVFTTVRGWKDHF